MADREYVVTAINDVLTTLNRYVDLDSSSTDFQPVILRLDYLHRLVVNLAIDDFVIEMISLAYRTLVEIDNNETISGYRASTDTTGQRGRPSFEIGEEQLSYLLEQGFNVRDIGSILGVSVRTVERRMSSFGLTVSGIGKEVRGSMIT
ncbi:Nuclear pore complex Nup107, partial [Paramuricea clavata]